MPPEKNFIERRIEQMGDEIGPIFAYLWAECLDLNIAWGEFKTLYTNRENFEIFNAEASRFFGHLQNLMIQDLVLRVARMVDKSSRQDNLSLEVLRSKLSTSDQAALKDDFKKLELDSEFAVSWRHKLYAHKDLAVTLGNSATPLPDANRLRMEAAINNINRIMDRIAQAFGGGVTAWNCDEGRASRQIIARLKIAHTTRKVG